MDRSKQLLSAALLLCLAVGCQQAESPASGASQSSAAEPVSSIVKVSALANGEILLDGKPCTLDQFTARLTEAQKIGGEVYYYREGADQEPHPNAMTAMKRIAGSHLP